MNRPAYLISQQGKPSLPSSNSLAEVVLWDYSFTCGLYEDATFELTFDGQPTIRCTVALEDADGIAQIRITTSSGAVPLVMLPDMTLETTADGVYHYRNAEGELLTFENAQWMQTRTIVFQRLDVLAAQSARASVQGVAFDSPLVPQLENHERIDIGGNPSSIAAHLTSLFQTLLAHSPFVAQPLAIECRYAHTIGGIEIAIPVVLLPRHDFAIASDIPVLEQIDESIHQWRDAAQPPETEARLVFTLSFWSAKVASDAPILRLTNVSLAMRDVVM